MPPTDQADSRNIKLSLDPILNQARAANKRLGDLESNEGTRLATIAVSTPNTVANTDAITDLVSTLLRGNSLRSNQIIRAYLPFIYLNSTGGPATFRAWLAYGGANILAFDSVSPTNNAANRPGHMDLTIKGNGLDTAQEAFGRIVFGPVLGTPTTDHLEYYASGSLTTIDSALDQTLAVKVAHGTISPNISIIAKLFLVTGPYVP